jgi:uracil-DNA glycosylase
MDTPERFVADLSAASIGATVNPYSAFDPAFDKEGGATLRAANLVSYLHSRMSPELLLVGEAPGYQGCRFSGVAFTSERSLPPAFRSSLRPEGWAEPSATIVHRALHDLGIEDDVALWNACPMHPAAGRTDSNRTPTRAEVDEGALWLDRLIALLSPRVVIPVGRSAAAALGVSECLRHPANGGARKFRDGLTACATEMGLVR